MSTKKLQILTPIVTSINGKTGDVTIDMDKTAVGLDKVDNTSDADKPISTATKTALDGKQDKITAKGLLRGDGTGNIAAVDGSFLAYEPIADVEATTPIDADTLNGKTYDYINSTKQDKLTTGDNISIDNNVISTKVYPCNPNLLDNWYFGNPVNQRGQASYSGIGYGIDRWKANAATPNVTTIKDGYIELSQNALIEHVLEEPYILCERQVTASVLLTTRLYTFTTTIPSKEELSAVTEDKILGNTYFVVNGKSAGYIDLLHTKAHITMLRLRAFEGYTLGAIAAKLELGGVQTLAHLDADGNWALNEIPNKDEECIKCITSTADPTDTYANKVIATTDQLHNSNLLKNWCFLKGYVVNQRGQTSYSTSGYGIDMWKSSSANLTVKVEDDGLMLTNTGTTTAYLNQYIENSVNASVLSALVTSVTGTGYVQAHYVDNTYSMAQKAATGLNTYILDRSKAVDRVLIQVNASSSVKLQAVKLERGDAQTLVHNTVSDGLVLNELPDYSEQLALCQRYFITYGGTTFNIHLGYVMATTVTGGNTFIVAPVTMRTTPTVSFTANTLKLHDGTNSIDVSSITMNVASKNILYTRVASTGLTKAEMYALRLEKGKINFSAEL